MSYDVISFSDVDARMARVREGYQYEGEVLYFIDDANDVIGLLKKKTIWYVDSGCMYNAMGHGDILLKFRSSYACIMLASLGAILPPKGIMWPSG